MSNQAMSQPFPPPPPPPPAQAFCPSCSYPLQPGTATCPGCGRAVGTAPAGNRSTKLIVGIVLGAGCLLALVAIGGIVAAIAVPAFVSAKERAKQAETIADMRRIAVALESFHAQANVYPGGESFAAIAAQLASHGFEAGKTADAWGHPYRWSCWEPDGDGCASYSLVSPGKDGAFETTGGYQEGPFPLDSFDADIVVSDGMFSRWPEGEGRLATQGG
jgi:type II secretory pathway pseudopilin PulG